MVKGQDLGWGMGARERAQGWALSFILMPYPSSLSLTLGQSQVNTFCFSGKRIQSIAPPSFVFVQYLIKSLTVIVLSVQKS